MNSRLGRALLLILAIAGTTFFGWVLFVGFFPTWAGWRAFTYAVDSIVDASGWNRYLVQAVAVLALGPLVWAIAEIIRLGVFTRVADALKGRSSVVWRKKAAATVIVCYLSGFWLVMYVAGRDGGFSQSTGEARRWYAMTPEGIREFDSPGYDPKYGIQLKAITPEIRQSVERAKLGQIPARIPPQRVDAIQFFDPLTNEPRVWYADSNAGSIDLFSAPGFHPTYGQPLRPVNLEIIVELQRRESDAKAGAAAERATEEAEQTRKRAAVVQAKRQEYLNRYLSGATPPSRILIAVDENNAVDRDFSAALARAFGASETFVRGTFVSDGLFLRALDGDASVLSDLGLSERAVILVRKRAAIRRQVELDRDLVSADVFISVRVAGTPGNLPTTFSTAAVGAGFSEKQAVANAEEQIVTKVTRQLSGG